MVSVSLLRLVAIADTRPVWPPDFEGKIAKLDDEPNERAQWGIIADWCDENEEPQLARAFRWMSKRKLVDVRNTRPPGLKPLYWMLEGIPPALASIFPQNADRSTLAGLMADLAAALEELDNSAN